ncbi:MAG: ribonuclease D [Pseudomonadota bacterium]|nr:ribonuclease D [Pseudomonadota bacterium]
MRDTDLLIDNTKSLTSLISNSLAETIISLDTEFLRERTYFPQLCLIQVATPQLTACVDCLADLDLQPLLEYLLEPQRIWLLHSARQDLEVIHQHSNGLPNQLIDSQIAAGLLGYAPQIGLQDLLEEVLNVKLDKTLARTNWADRPLPGPAVQYALDDVRYLSALWEILKSELEDRNRLGWLKEDCQLALNAPLVTPAVTLWARLKGLSSMEDNVKYAALSLVEWREKCAQKLNRPRRWILSDVLLLRIAKTLPTTQKNLASIAEMPPRLAERFGAEILAAAANHDQSEEISSIQKQLDKPRPDKNKLKQLQDDFKQRAQELGIRPEVLATRKELCELIVGTASGRVAKGGWRWDVLSDLV